MKMRRDYSVTFLPDVDSRGGAHEPRALAQELKRIERENGALRPSDVVRAARDASNILHRYFDWSDDSAARRWRVHQARQLIQSVRVQFVDLPEREPFRAFLHVPAAEQQRYGSTERVMSDPEQRALVLERALTELQSFKKRYADLSELATVFAAADRVVKRLRR